MPKKRVDKPVPEPFQPVPTSWKNGEPKSRLLECFSYEPIKKKRRSLLDIFRKDFKEIKNPLSVWDAYAIARADGEPVPSWVLEYFDKVAKRLLNPKKKAKDIPRALMFYDAAGPGPFKQYHSFQIRRTALIHVLNALKKTPDLSIENASFAAVEAVEKRWGVSVEWNTIMRVNRH